MNSSLKTNTTASIGFLVGIGAWSITFLTLIWGYLFYRLRAEEWLTGYITETVLLKALLNSGLLLLSAWGLHQFLHKRMTGFFSLGLLAGAAFILGQVDLWMRIVQNGLTFTNAIAGSFLYLLTGFHALHVVIGLLFLLPFGLNLGREVNEENESRFIFALKFWDLLTVFWFVLFVLIFIIK